MSPAVPPDARNLNTLWAGVLVETLHRCGVAQAVVAPGSRSAPLALALAAHPGIEAVPVLDERSAAFFALGLAKQRLQPVALVCTSGTAAANFLPAIIEAHESGVPLVVLTADRPPELRACASGQTIDQLKLYGAHVRHFQELALPELATDRLQHLRQAVARAVALAAGPAAGPVHLNVPLRDPLAPVPDDGATARFAAGTDWERFFSHLTPVVPPSVVEPVPGIVPEVHGVIVAGPTQPGDVAAYLAAVELIARKLGWPVLADGLSPLRQHAPRFPHLVTTYDVILRHPATAERLRPEAVLCLGDWPTSKMLRGWLAGSDATVWLAASGTENRDALHLRTRQLAVSLPALAALLPAATDVNGYQRMWARYEERIRPALDARLGAEAAMFEPKAAWLLARHLPPGTPVFVANSMPARDVEHVWPAGDRRLRPLSNRGANGIDGTLSTALGIAHRAGQPAVLLTGDLSLLHDANGFLLRPRFGGGLTIVLINNRGGGIFEHLPVAAAGQAFEDFCATPQDTDFGALAVAHGVPFTAVRDWEHLVSLVSVLPPAGIRILEVRTDRKADAAGRKRLFAELAATLG